MTSAIPPEADADAITSTELLVFAEEIVRIAPELGVAMDARLFRGHAVLCFSFRQLELFLGGKILRRAEQRGEYAQGTWLPEWLPEPIVVMLDDAIFTPLASEQPPTMARNATEFLCFIAGWLRAAEERLRAHDDEHAKRLALIGLIAKIAVGRILLVGSVIRKTVLVRRLAILAEQPRFVGGRRTGERAAGRRYHRRGRRTESPVDHGRRARPRRR